VEREFELVPNVHKPTRNITLQISRAAKTKNLGTPPVNRAQIQVIKASGTVRNGHGDQQTQDFKKRKGFNTNINSQRGRLLREQRYNYGTDTVIYFVLFVDV
jgi:hypothetical protein